MKPINFYWSLLEWGLLIMGVIQQPVLQYPMDMCEETVQALQAEAEFSILT